MDPKLESFERSFRSGMSSCRNGCQCGKIYYDNFNSGIDWEDGEYERLEKIGVPAGGSIGGIRIEGKEYAECCNCWHPHALRVIAFIERHSHAIANYFTAEKARKHAEADTSPVVR